MADNDDPRAIRQRLADSLDEAEWNWIKPHAERGAIIIAAADLPLIEVGVAMAIDDRVRVGEWVASQSLTKPTPEQIAAWEKRPTTLFRCLVIQPFVLIQEVLMN
jgi:hypothetical protein